MGFMDHLDEFRQRLISSTIVLVLATFVCFTFSEDLFLWLQTPLTKIPGQKMMVLGPLEMFVTYLKLSMLAGLFVSAPWHLYQFWRFVSPGLYRTERRWVLPFIVLGTLFFVGGAAFAFYLVLPMGFDYLIKMTPETVISQYSVAIYVSLVTHMLLAFAIIFELPLVMWILGASGVVTPDAMASIRRYWIVAAFVIGGVLTPPDPITQIMMAVPLLLFYELGIFGARILCRTKTETLVQNENTGAGL